MNTLQQIIALASGDLVKTRAKYKDKLNDLITNIIKTNSKFDVSHILIDLLGYTLYECTLILKAVKDDNLTFSEAIDKHF